MAPVLSNDPLASAFAALAQQTLPIPKGRGHGTLSQHKRLDAWNSKVGIRAQAASARLITSAENKQLRQALYLWPWMNAATRKQVNRIIAMLFYVRCKHGLTGFDRTQLSTIQQFQFDRQRVHRTPSAPRRRREKVRASFALLG